MNKHDFQTAVQDQIARHEAILELSKDNWPSQIDSFSHDPHFLYTLVEDACQFAHELVEQFCIVPEDYNSHHPD